MILIEKNRQKRGLIAGQALDGNSFDDRQEWTSSKGCDDNESLVITEEDISDVEEVIKLNDIIDKAYKAFERESVLALHRPFLNYDASFTELEECRLTELIQALSSVENVLNSSRIFRDCSSTIADIIMHSSMFYEQKGLDLINTIKKISAFEAINLADKLTMVKYGGVEILILRTVNFYDCAMESWIVPLVSCK